MLLLTGPPGAGKSRRVLEQVRDALGRGAAEFRLLVPTATMAEHLRNQMAREGFLVRPGLILTLSRFVAGFAQDCPELSPAALELLVARVLAQETPPAFAQVGHLPGFRACVTRLIDELSTAGCTARSFAKLLAAPEADAPLAPAFLSIFESVENELMRRGWELRAGRLRSAAMEIRARGLGRVQRVLLDGFFTFSDPELELIDAIRSRAGVTIALPLWDGAEQAREALLGFGLAEERLSSGGHRAPATVLVTASSIEQEADEIARRILEHAAAGRPFRDAGVVLRGREPYVPVLRAAFERFGIPARFYFSEPLAGHSVVRMFMAAIEAMRSGWEHQQTLTLLKMTACGFGATSACDRFDFVVRERLPGRGLSALRELSDHPRLRVLIDRLASLEPWRAQRMLPRDWAARFKSLRCLFQPPHVTDGATEDTAALWRGQAAALEAFDAAMDEAAAAMAPNYTAPFSEFWEAASLVLGETQLRVPDRRRNVVHVMDVYEARQWELPVVFVCGLLEKQFPLYHAAGPILPEAARARLQRAGLRIKTGAERQREEEFLFGVATSRATAELVLSYPECNAKGEPNLPSFFLDRFAGVARVPARPAAPRTAAPQPPLRFPYIRDDRLLETIRNEHAVLAPTAVEDFLQCPFQFFLRHTLGLEEPPELPGERLGAALQGKIVHQVLAEFEGRREPLETIFDRVFDEACECARVPRGCRAEMVRLRMLRDLRRYAAEARRLEGWTTFTEKEVRFVLDDSVDLAGRIDRFDVSPDRRAVVFDFKYSSPQGIRRRIRGYEEGRSVQGALYLLGLERIFEFTPAGMFYWGLRGQLTLGGWHIALPGFERTGTSCTPAELRERLESARAITLRAADEIRRGRVEASPEDRERCEYCAYTDACRVSLPLVAQAAAPSGAPGAGGGE